MIIRNTKHSLLLLLLFSLLYHATLQFLFRSPCISRHTFPRNLKLQSAFDAINEKYVDSDTAKKLLNGQIDMQEIDSIFVPSDDDLEVMSRSFSKGFVGCIFSLESSILNLEELFLQSLDHFLFEISESSRIDQSKFEIFSTPENYLGKTFQSTLTSLSLKSVDYWNPIQCNLLEKRFFLILEDLLRHNPSLVKLDPSFLSFFKQLLHDENKISIITNFPRSIATFLLSHASLLPICEKSVPEKCFITPKNDVFCYDFSKLISSSEEKPQITDSSSLFQVLFKETKRFDRSQFKSLQESSSSSSSSLSELNYQEILYAKACGMMQKYSSLSFLFDSNPQNIAIAKELGLNVIRMDKNKKERDYFRKESIPSFRDISTKELYATALGAVKSRVVTASAGRLDPIPIRPPSVQSKKTQKNGENGSSAANSRNQQNDNNHQQNNNNMNNNLRVSRGTPSERRNGFESFDLFKFNRPDPAEVVEEEEYKKQKQLEIVYGKDEMKLKSIYEEDMIGERGEDDDSRGSTGIDWSKFNRGESPHDEDDDQDDSYEENYDPVP
jgi:FMN phosphatase YigB (HAD superfamily)